MVRDLARGAMTICTEGTLAARVARRVSRVACRVSLRDGERRESPTVALPLTADLGGEADTTALGRRRVHELADGREDCGDRVVVRRELLLDAGFKLIDALRELVVRGEHLAH